MTKTLSVLALAIALPLSGTSAVEACFSANCAIFEVGFASGFESGTIIYAGSRTELPDPEMWVARIVLDFWPLDAARARVAEGAAVHRSAMNWTPGIVLPHLHGYLDAVFENGQGD